MVELGIVGKPNVGKSTFFAAATLQTVEIGNYPFTTIEANRAIGYVRKPCPHLELGKQCNPKKSLCIEGTRYIPVELIDVAGLVPEAHAGRGLGNKFLDDLRHADALIHIIDVSGSTDAEGNPVPKGSRDPCKDVDFLDKEIAYWIADIIGRGWTRIARRLEAEKVKIEVAIAERLSGLNINDKQVHAAISHLNLDEKPSRWKEEDILALSFEIRRIAKPMVIAANKADITDEEYLNKFLQKCREKGYDVIPISADYELALRRAAKAGLVDYKPGDEDFKILKEDELSAAQLKALEKIREFMHKFGGTGVQRVIEHTVFNVLQMIAVYPVEDEHKWTDKDGNVLPDVYLFPLGSTALDIAYKVHTDLGENFIRAVDGRSKKILGHDYELKDGDVIKIIARR
ncbi:GTPase, putative [Aciduliprofundum boonei T469]|nr:GTPase, putative [Aciduliprofundum boonei T469]